MASIKPFRALRPHNEYVAQVASRPYDVLSSAEARKEAASNFLSFLHVTKSEIDLPEDIDTHSEAVYLKAKENLDLLRERKILFQDEAPCYYLYQLSWKGRSQTGLVCLSSVDDYRKDIIKKHEFTRPEKEKDRIDHMLALKAQTGNVFMACKNIKDLDDVLEHWKKQHIADYDFTADDGVTHTVWVVNAPATIDTLTHIFSTKIPYTYIADGHHRAASAAKVSDVLPGNDDAGYFLTTIFPDNQLAILEYNRVVKDLNGMEDAEFLRLLGEDFELQKEEKAVQPTALHEFGLYLRKQWYLLRAKSNIIEQDPVNMLDVSILQKNILDKRLNIKDPRTDPRIDFIGGIRGLQELEKRVDSGEMKAAFSLYPVSMQQLFDIAGSGAVMPPKSTWFEPKLRDGILTHLI